MIHGVKNAKLFNFAADTSSSIAHKDLEFVKNKLEEDADAILSFMASNGLVANQSKTVLMIMNNKITREEETLVKVRVRETLIEQEKSLKLLGIMIEENQGWKEHFMGKNGLISFLNKRLITIRRVGNQLSKSNFLRLA